MNSFFPDSSRFFNESGHFCGYLESIIQLPHGQCLVPTIISYHKNEEKKQFFFEKSVNAHTRHSNQMQCLSESCGGSNLFLESVRCAIQVWSQTYLQSQTRTMPTLVPILLQNQQGEHLHCEHLVNSFHLLHEEKSKSVLFISICIGFAQVMFNEIEGRSI